MRHFKTEKVTDNVKFILAPDGKRVLIYTETCFGRMGSTREYTLYTTDNSGRYDDELISCHGGYLRSVLRYLKGGPIDDYDVTGNPKAMAVLTAIRDAYKEQL